MHLVCMMHATKGLVESCVHDGSMCALVVEVHHEREHTLAIDILHEGGVDVRLEAGACFVARELEALVEAHRLPVALTRTESKWANVPYVLPRQEGH